MEPPETQDADSVIIHLRDLVEAYESLVQDMSSTLVQNQEQLATFTGQVFHSETETAGDFDDVPSSGPCPDCLHSKRIIDNLLKQIDSLIKAKKLTTALWHSSAEQIEQLESRLTSKSTNSTPPPTLDVIAIKASCDNQQKLYQSYMHRLEGRLDQCLNEKNFYRRKLIEAKLEHEGKLKDFQIQKHKDVDLVKSTYLKEIETVKEQLEKERQGARSHLEKRLQEERQRWSAEETRSKDQMKKTWRIQLDQLLTEQQALVLRESQLGERLHQVQMQLLQTQQLLWCSAPPAVQPTSTDIFAAAESTRKPEKSHVATTTTENDLLKRIQCPHDECVRYSQHEKLNRENERLGEEVYRLEKSKQTLEADYKQTASRLEQRIRDLEHLNSQLQTHLIDRFSKKVEGSSSSDINRGEEPAISGSANRVASIFSQVGDKENGLKTIFKTSTRDNPIGASFFNDPFANHS